MGRSRPARGPRYNWYVLVAWRLLISSGLVGYRLNRAVARERFRISHRRDACARRRADPYSYRDRRGCGEAEFGDVSTPAAPMRKIRLLLPGRAVARRHLRWGRRALYVRRAATSGPHHHPPTDNGLFRMMRPAWRIWRQLGDAAPAYVPLYRRLAIRALL